MDATKIIELIEGSDLTPVQKSINKGFILRSTGFENERNSERELIKKTLNRNTRDDFSFEIVISTDRMKVIKIIGSNDTWDMKYPYRGIFKDEKGDWRRNSNCSGNPDEAMLDLLGKIHDGENSRFSHFAIRMLKIDVKEEW